MNEISKEYAKALFMLAIENEKDEEYEKALDLVINVFSENPDYTEFLESPAVALEERCEALESAFKDSLPREVLSFLKLLCEKRHIKELPGCVSHYKELINEVKNVTTAKVISAIELDEKRKSALKEKLEKSTGGTVIIEYSVDKSILGGLIVEMDGKVIDSSLKKHLKDVKDVITR